MLKYQWILDGLAKPGKSKKGLAKALGRSPSTVTDILSDDDKKKPRKLLWDDVPIIADYLDVIPPPVAGTVPIVGHAGHSPHGTVEFVPQRRVGEVPMPLGGRKDTVAIEINGDNLRAEASDGSLLFYDAPMPPTPEMEGQLCVVWLEDGRALLKFLHTRDSGLYDLESGSAPILRDVRVVKAALVTTIVTPTQAKKIIQREKK